MPPGCVWQTTQMPDRTPRTLEGVTLVVIGGTLPRSRREDATASAQAAGARVASSVSKKTTFVVAGRESGHEAHEGGGAGRRGDRRGRVPAPSGRDGMPRRRATRFRGPSPRSAAALQILLAVVGASARSYDAVGSSRAALRHVRAARARPSAPVYGRDTGRAAVPHGSLLGASRSLVSPLTWATIVVWLIWQHHATANLWARGLPRPAYPARLGGRMVVHPFASLAMPSWRCWSSTVARRRTAHRVRRARCWGCGGRAWLANWVDRRCWGSAAP